MPKHEFQLRLIFRCCYNPEDTHLLGGQNVVTRQLLKSTNNYKTRRQRLHWQQLKAVVTNTPTLDHTHAIYLCCKWQQ